MYTHEKKIITRGKPLSETGKALILVHGRGATAESILNLAPELDASDFTLFAPQATQHSWYPYSFMAPVAQNQPALDSALKLLENTVTEIENQGIPSQQIYIAGFSQGACLTAEFACRNARNFGGLLIFTGGLIGQEINPTNYKGNFEGTPVFISTGDPDPHVPVSRVEETVQILTEKGAQVTKRIYSGRPHTINQEEINLAKKLLAGEKLS